MSEPTRDPGWRQGYRLVAVLGLAGCTETGIVAGLDSGVGPEEAEVFARPALGPDAPLPIGDEMLDAWAAPAPEPPMASDALFAEGSVHRIDLELDAAARLALADEPREDVPATLRFGEQRWLVGLRLKGSFSYRDLPEKASFKIDFQEYEVDQRFFGLQRITLNAMVQDGSMIREHEAYWMYRRLGVPAPRHGYAEVWLDGQRMGLYGVLETIDGTFAERAFPRDAAGPIYEGGYGVDLDDSDPARFDMHRQGELVEPWSDLAALQAGLLATTPDTYLAWLEDRFDADALFRMWALDLVLGHRDGYVGRGNNFLLYHGLQSDRWWMIPWGQDQTFRDGLAVHGGYAGELATRCEASPACMERLDEELRYVAATWERWDLYTHAQETASKIAVACEQDPKKEMPCHAAGVLEMIAARPAEVRAQLQE
ncbi:MAG: CotH kinase family protein [Pseudomonadota bacterium]|nr:CotH kinase family protein [Pseudomonadota bacterium]